jgi:four helix bundle protein
MMQITELEVWKAAMDLATSLYEITPGFGEPEPYGLGYQIRRTISGLPANVSAAASRKYGNESLHHLQKGKSILYETETLIYLAARLRYINEEDRDKLLEQVETSKKLLFGFIKYYKNSGHNSSSPRTQNTPPFAEE